MEQKRIYSQFIRLALLLFISLPFSHTSWSKVPPTQLQCDPPNWWVGMSYSHIAILVQGGHFHAIQNVSCDAPQAAVVDGFRKLPNENYLIVDLSVLPNASPQSIHLIFSFSNKQKPISLPFTLQARQNYQPRGLTSNDLMYLIFPDRFANGNPLNDSIPGMKQGVNRTGRKTRHGGDLQGILNHLDYLEKIHATALWLNPVLENNQPIDSYHGYAVTHSYRVDPRLGTNADFKMLSDRCHEKGIATVWDIIYNHWGNEHYLFKNIPDSSWFHFHPTFTKTNYRAETIADPYASDVDQSAMLNGWFDLHMPDLNQHNPDLAQYLIQNTIWWVEYAGIDALRMDTYPYPDQDFMDELAQVLWTEYPNLYLFGETWIQGIPIQASFTQDQGGYSANGLDGVTDFQFYFALTKGLNEPFGWDEGLRRIEMCLAQDFVYPDPKNMNVAFLDNHDLSRIFSVLHGDQTKWKIALGMLMTSPRIPCVYYGTEFQFEGFTDPDDLVRQEFPGGWEGDTKNLFTGQHVSSQEAAAFEYFRKLAAWRKASSLADLDMTQFVPEDNVYVYARYNSNHTYLCIINLNDQPYSLNLNRFKEVQSGTKLIDVLENTILWSEDNLSPSPLNPLILSQPGFYLLEWK